jgi:hypothetical protein
MIFKPLSQAERLKTGTDGKESKKNFIIETRTDRDERGKYFIN